MDSTVLAAIIGGLCTIGASIGAVFLTRLFDNPLGFKKDRRLAALAGQWEGTVHQEGPPTIDFRQTVYIKLAGRTVRGEGTVFSQAYMITEPFTFFGGFVHDRFLRLEYEIQNQPGSVQFGYAILDLSPDGKTLSGKFVGYGALVTRDLVNGTTQLQKQGATQPVITATSSATSP